jgi:hypothetical protein
MKTIREVVDAFRALRWTVEVDEKGDGFAYAVLGGVRETGEVYVLAVIQNATSPLHIHRAGAQYGEKIGTFVGELYDKDDEGNDIVIGSKDVVIHRTSTPHAPRADFWFGYYHQPRGSELVPEWEGQQNLA